MNKRKLVTVVVIIGVAAILTTCLPMTQVRANHCHPEHTKTAATPPTPTTKPAARTRTSTQSHQRTFTRIPNPINKPVRSSVSSFENRTVGSETLSFEDIYSRDFPMAIVSIGEAVKAIESGDRQTELAELTKALDKLMKVYKAMGTQVKPQFANSLRCPIMGSPIDINMVDDSLTRDYNGRKVAFCCAGCPSAWDKLSNSEKQSKVPGLKS